MNASTNTNTNTNSRLGYLNRTKKFGSEIKTRINKKIEKYMNIETIQLFLLLLALVMLTSVMLGFSNPLQFDSSSTRYIISFCTLFFFLMLMLLYVTTTSSSTTDTIKLRAYLTNFLGIFISGFGFIFLATLPFILTVSSSQILSGTLLFVIVCILIITIAIVIYALFHAYLADKNDYSYAGLLKNTILYLPCLLISFITWIKKEYNLTTKPFFILLILDIIFIIWYFNLISFEKNLKLTNETTLLKDPIYLSDEKIIGNYEDLKKANDKIVKNKKEHSFEYYVEEI